MSDRTSKKSSFSLSNLDIGKVFGICLLFIPVVLFIRYENSQQNPSMREVDAWVFSGYSQLVLAGRDNPDNVWVTLDHIGHVKDNRYQIRYDGKTRTAYTNYHFAEAGQQLVRIKTHRSIALCDLDVSDRMFMHSCYVYDEKRH